MPTSPVVPSGNTNKATELGSTTTTPVVTRENPVAISDAATNNTTSDGSTTEGPTRQSTPISIRTSVQQSSAVSQRGHTLGSHSTQESQITGSVSPMTDNINTVTTPTPSFKPSGPSPSGTFPQDTSATSEGTTFTTAQPTDIMNKTQVTRELLATPTRPDTTLGTSADTAHSIASTTPQVTSLFSTSGGPAGQSAGPSTTTSPDATSAFFQTHQTQSIETTGQPDTSKPASSVTHTTLEGTTTSSSSTANSPTASGSASPETATPGKVTIFSAAPSINSHITQSTTDSLSTVPSLVTTPEIMGNVSNPVTSTILPTVSEVSTTGGPTEQSTPTSSSSSPGETSAISHMAQTTRNITTRGSETFTSVSQVTDTISTVTSPPPSPPTNGHTFPQTMATTTSPSGTSTTFLSSSVTNGHTTPGPAVTWSSTTAFTGHTNPLPYVNASTSATASSGSTVKPQTPGMMTASLRTSSERSTATSLPTTSLWTLTTSTPSTSTVTHSTAPPVPSKPDRGVPLFPYGLNVRDQEFVKRTVDFTSPLFKPEIGFPFGSSLRDSLYFTDNGQIIFPESDYQIFSYPNPYRRVFTSWDPVALVAPFWDDADFSGHRGTMFYQEYKTFYDEYNPLVRQVESWIEKFANVWYYKARWTLKITWVNVPAYPASWTLGTNTYQAILSTDGSKSYALFLYQSGGMQWDPAQHQDNSVLIGFSSGDGYFQNSPLTFRPVWEKYRPDQFLNNDSGLRGLQLYRLHREERPNYRLKCLQWLMRQPQWPSWAWNQISCPCSWQQGLWDLRFQPTNIGWWGLGNRQLCSFSSWRGGVCCSYGPWGEFREGWRVQQPWQFVQELEPQNWCCRWNDKPFFCTLYHQRQPRVSCAGYRPPRLAWMFGDPHITTLDGANYTFNGLGDFLLVQAQDGNSSFLLQGRTAQTGTAQATNFIAFAAQYNSSRLDPITVQWFLEPNDKIHVQLNDKNVTFEANREDAEGQEIFNTTGIILTRNGSLVSANFDGTVTISVIALSNILHASSSLPEEYKNRTEGLLGVWNDNPDDDFRRPNGSTVPQESSEEMIFHYGMSWKINGTSILGKRSDQLPSNFTPVFLDQLRNASSNLSLASECNEDPQCIFDSLAMQNVNAGLHTRMLFRRFQEINATLNQYPPSIKGALEIKAFKGQTEWIQYTSSSENVTFSLRHNSTDFTLFENGTLLWTPKSPEPFTLKILARNAKNGLSSELQPSTVACFCSTQRQCLYNQTSRAGNSSLEVAACSCDGDTFGRYCESFRDPCEHCFPNVSCIPGKGCEACPPHMTGDGRHCAVVENPFLCQNKSCPVNYCYNNGHCYISQTSGCQARCTCPPAFIDSRCFLAGNNFTPTASPELPLRIIQLSLSEEENASIAEVDASVAYRLRTLDVPAFFRNSLVEAHDSTTLGTGRLLRRWRVISEFQYRPRGPVINFLTNQLLDAVVEAFLPQPLRRRWRRNEDPRHDVVFHPISRDDIRDLKSLNLSTLETYFNCSGYKGYHLVYSPQNGFTCVSPCSEGYCENGGQCQHLPEGPQCSCVPFSIYMPWGKHCEHLSIKLRAFFGILFGALGALLLLGTAVFVVLRFRNCSGTFSSYPLDSES
ncbi:mucin-4 [Loxodonta africana]|uniref:mucin-4 n=1 Tax=Loxodonta africana TaxID=9785 RepID=UPI0030D49F62